MRAVLLCLLLVGCADLTAPEGAIPFTPRPEWATWWEELEDCAHRTGDFHRIDWQLVIPPPHNISFPCRIGSCVGLWVAPHTIYLAGVAEGVISVDSLTTASGRTIRHEMLHDLLQTGHHPVAFDWCGVR